MPRMRSEFEFDRSDDKKLTAFATGKNKYETSCGTCGAAIFFDELMRDRLGNAVEQGLKENPLLCEKCEMDIENEESMS